MVRSDHLQVDEISQGERIEEGEIRSRGSQERKESLEVAAPG